MRKILNVSVSCVALIALIYMPNEDILELANRLMDFGVPGATEFTQVWISFNACYNLAPDRYERDKVMKTIRLYISDAKAESILNIVKNNIQFFTQLPPGNTKKSQYDPAFREQSTNDLIFVNNSANTYVDRLAHLASVLYTVRCSLIHGRKHPDSARDRAVVENSIPALNMIVRAVLDGMK